MQYRRAKIKGGTYFFTLNLADRRETLLIDYIDDLRESLNVVKQRHPFKLDAMVVLPDHLHAMITLPNNDDQYAMRWMLIKQRFSRQIPNIERTNKSRQLRGERGIWQRRYWEHVIRDQDDYQQHVHYIHYNPVKHGYVENAVDWEFSTLHRYIQKGIIHPDWGNVKEDSLHNKDYGERK